MGNPVNFDGVNVTLSAAAGDENVQDMGAFRNHAACVSCWELDQEEIEEITRTGRVFLSVLMGGSQPPVAVGSETRIRGLMLDFGPVWPAPVTAPPQTNVEDHAALIERVEKLIIDALGWEPSETGESYAAIRRRLDAGIRAALATAEGQPNG